MNVASLNLCRDLYELSGWDNDAGTSSADRLKVWMPSYHTSMMGQGNPQYEKTPPSERNKVIAGEMHVTDDPRHQVNIPEVVFEWWWHDVQELEKQLVPAYDLGYLLRMLPAYYSTYGDDGDDCILRTQATFNEREWWAYYNGPGEKLSFMQIADTPEDAAAKLAIELFKQGILTRDGDA